MLHGGAVDGFCIVSSDSDFTQLATRIREQGLFVMGIGREHTPSAFVKVCDCFTFAENLVDVDADAELSADKFHLTIKKRKIDSELITEVRHQNIASIGQSGVS